MAVKPARLFCKAMFDDGPEDVERTYQHWFWLSVAQPSVRQTPGKRYVKMPQFMGNVILDAAIFLAEERKPLKIVSTMLLCLIPVGRWQKTQTLLFLP
ncbi:MAG: hypothetical protein IPL08_09785 [Saprospiraceae bacterium]|nr:hypothetical protein [Saprospiraceae bacterium]